MKPPVLLATRDLRLAAGIKKELTSQCRLAVCMSRNKALKSLGRERWAALVRDVKLPGLGMAEFVEAARTKVPWDAWFVNAGRRDLSPPFAVWSGARLISVARSVGEIAKALRGMVTRPRPEQIISTRYEAQGDVFLVTFGSGQTYKLPRDIIEANDRTPVVAWRVELDGDAFVVRQQSGKTYDVAWDFVLYHCEPSYPYYKERREQQRSEARWSEQIGGRVREAREGRGWSLEDLARRSGMHAPNLSRLEAGKHLPSLESLERVAKALRVRVADLVAA